jgi:NAD-dependent deacetylase
MIVSPTLQTRLAEAESVCVLTGAGVSAESGVPTFRGADGLWSKFKPEELANFDAFIRNPELVWEWYSYRKKVISEVQPNAAHTALAAMERLVHDFTLVTQNVDNLHTRAGSKNILELHGNIHRNFCIDCGTFYPDVVLDDKKKVPQCQNCGGLIRPDVVWFGELLPMEMFRKAESAAERCDVFLCIGTSAVVYPAASLPQTALNNGAYVVEINEENTDISPRVHETIIGKSGTIVPTLLEVIQRSRIEEP